jgi:hypothetical protein
MLICLGLISWGDGLEACVQLKVYMKHLKLVVVGLAVCVGVMHGQQNTRRADITGNAVDGKCTIEVTVDGAAEVEVQGTVGRIRNLSGQRADWVRFVCNGQMPNNPQDFRFRGIDGRGNVQLVQDPRQNGGRIVFRIEDPKGGREGYTVDLEWRGGSGGQWNSEDNRGWNGPSYGNGGGVFGNDNNRDSRYYDQNGRWNSAGTAQASQICQSAVRERIQRDGFRNITFQNLRADYNAGRNDTLTGVAKAGRGMGRNVKYQFSCSVNLANGQVRSVEVNRR